MDAQKGGVIFSLDAPLKKFSKNVDFRLQSKQCIVLPKWTFFCVLAHCVHLIWSTNQQCLDAFLPLTRDEAIWQVNSMASRSPVEYCMIQFVGILLKKKKLTKKSVILHTFFSTKVGARTLIPHLVQEKVDSHVLLFFQQKVYIF